MCTANWLLHGAGSCTEDAKAVGSGCPLKSQLHRTGTYQEQREKQSRDCSPLGGSHNTNDTEERSHTCEMYCAPHQ